MERAKSEEAQASSKRVKLLRIEGASPVLFLCFRMCGVGRGVRGVRRRTQRWGSERVVVVEKAKGGGIAAPGVV